ncbi:hypothetical protein JCM5353_004898 [Sporobolomyces roseus]
MSSSVPFTNGSTTSAGPGIDRVPPLASTSTSPSFSPARPPNGAVRSIRERERSGDDQQISQILAEMSQQSASTASVPAPDPPQAPRARLSRPRRSNPDYRDSASLSPPTFAAPRLPDVSSLDRVYSPPPPVASTSTLPAAEATLPPPPPSKQVAVNGEEGKTPAPDKSKPKPKAAAKAKPKKGRGKSDEHKGMPEEEWEKSRRANHKEVERRRRETINQGLDQLQALLPPPPPPLVPPGTPGAQRQNKSDILGHAINHIKEMRQSAQVDYNTWTLEKLLKDQEIKKGQQEIASLKEENMALRKRLQELEGSGEQGGGGEGEEERNAKRRRIEGETVS